MVELYENVIYFLEGKKAFEISAYIYNRIFTKKRLTSKFYDRFFRNFPKPQDNLWACVFRTFCEQFVLPTHFR